MSKSNVANQGSYSLILIYRIPAQNHAAMSNLQKQLAQIHKRHGTVNSQFYQLGKTNVFEGFTGIDKAVGAKSDEEVWIEVDTYQDADQFKKAMGAVGADKEAGPMYAQLYGLISQGYSVITGEFSHLKI